MVNQDQSTPTDAPLTALAMRSEIVVGEKMVQRPSLSPPFGDNELNIGLFLLSFPPHPLID